MIEFVVSVLKRVAIAVIVIIALLAAFRQGVASKPVFVGGSDLAQRERAGSPFDQDTSKYTPRQAAEFWNDWGNEYGHSGPVTNMFVCYMNAVRVMPHDAVYHRNLATSLFMFRKDAKEFYHVNEEQVFNMAIREYRKAMVLEPDNYELAKEYALIYYAMRPFRGDEAYKSWVKVLELAKKTPQTESIQEVYMNLGRIEYMRGNFASAKTWLNKVTLPSQVEIKNILLTRVAEHAQVSMNNTAETKAN